MFLFRIFDTIAPKGGAGYFMEKQIGLIHATFNAVHPMLDAFRQYEPSVKVLNYLDEGLLRSVNEHGGVTPMVLRQFISLLDRAADSKVDGILLSCSVFSPYIPMISPFFSMPIVSVDGAMLERAVDIGEKIGIIATVANAGPTTARQIETIASQKGKKVRVEVAVCTEAFDKLQADPLAHDKLIRDAAIALSNKVDVIVLAQISMARAVKGMADIPLPILTSPESSIRVIMQKII